MMFPNDRTWFKDVVFLFISHSSSSSAFIPTDELRRFQQVGAMMNEAASSQSRSNPVTVEPHLFRPAEACQQRF